MYRTPPVAWALAALTVALAAGAGRAADVDRHLPADTEVAVYVNVRQLLGAPLVKKHALQPVQAALERRVDVQQFLRAAGLDPLRDIESLLISGPGGTAPDKVLVAVRGSFNEDKIHAAASDYAKKNPELLTVRREGERLVYEVKTKDNPTPVYAVVFDAQTLVLSPSKEYLQDGLKARTGKAEPVGEAMSTLLKGTDDRQSLWVVARVTNDLKKLLASSPQTAEIASRLKTLTLTAVVTETAVLNLRIDTTDAQTAENAQRFLEGARAILSLAVVENDQYGKLLATLIDAIEINRDKNAVVASARITDALIEKGLAKDKR